MSDCDLCREPSRQSMHFLQNDESETWQHDINDICEDCIKGIIYRYEKKIWTIEGDQND